MTHPFQNQQIKTRSTVLRN